MARGHLALRSVLAAGVALSAFAVLPARAEVGVAAAVNTDARGTAPGGAPRVISLGNAIVFNERVSTDANGLVQILLLDGTTFTVGPNSDLTIDEFVYDPNTGEAKVVASLTKGAFRFVGARTSQTEGGAVVKTPVGTIGIRGAVSNIAYDPATGQGMAALVAGDRLNVTGANGATGVVFQTGFSAIFGEGGAPNIRKSTPAEIRAFLQQLAGKPGQSGGASSQPTDQTVEDSGVEEANSALPDTAPLPPVKPVQSNPIDTAEKNVGQIDVVTQQKLLTDIESHDQGSPGTPRLARIRTTPGPFTTEDGDFAAVPGPLGLAGFTAATRRDFILYALNGRLIGPNSGLNLPDLTGAAGDFGLAAFSVDGFVDGRAASGPAYAGRGDFAAYLLGFGGNPADHAYVVTGTPTNVRALLDTDPGFDVREYTLTQDPQRQSPIPFFMNDLYGSAGNVSATNVLAVEPGFSSHDTISVLQMSLDITGSGVNQKSAAMVIAGDVFFDQNGIARIETGRRGSFRHDAYAGPTNLRGGTATIEGPGGAHFFGANAEHFLFGADISAYNDSHFGNAYTGNPNDGYLGGGGPSSTTHVASLVSETPQAALGRTSRAGLGFMNGLMVSTQTGNDAPYIVGGGGPNMYLYLDAIQNTFVAGATVADIYDQDVGIEEYTLAFGGQGSGTFVDDNRYGGRFLPGPGIHTVTTDGGDTLDNVAGDNPGSYLISGRGVPVAGYQHCTACTFADWGWWGTRIRTPGGQSPDVPNERGDFVHLGTWVSGDFSDPAQVYNLSNLPFGGTATYDGTALGSVARTTVDGVAQYVARGDVSMSWNFTSRDGLFQLSNFDGMNASGTVTDPGATALFSGSLSGPGLIGEANGMFVDDGPNVAAGAIGEFTLDGTGVRAVGTFVTAGHAP